MTNADQYTVLKDYIEKTVANLRPTKPVEVIVNLGYDPMADYHPTYSKFIIVKTSKTQTKP